MTTQTTYSRKSYRNEKLSARFYFYSTLVGLKFSRCLELLEMEFDISESTICDIIAENNEFISRLEHKGFTTSELKKHYPFMNWQYHPQMPFQNPNQLRLTL